MFSARQTTSGTRAARAAVTGWAAIAVIMALLVAACSSSNKTTSTPTTGSGTSTAASGAASVIVKTGPVGAYLTDGAGRTVYVFAADTSNKPTCYGSCAQIWPPLTTSATPKAGSGATQSMLSTTTRNDGSTQVLYNNHPLYYYQGDTQPGQTNGQGINANGGLWWVVSPSGAAITGGSTPYPTHS